MTHTVHQKQQKLEKGDITHLGIAIPDLVFQSRDSGLALPGSRDPGSADP